MLRFVTPEDAISYPETDFGDFISEGSASHRDSWNKSLEGEKVERNAQSVVLPSKLDKCDCYSGGLLVG